MTIVSLAISAARAGAPDKTTDAVSSAAVTRLRSSFISCILLDLRVGKWAVSEAEFAQQFRPFVSPRTRLFEGAGGGEHGTVRQMAADDLHADRQAGVGEAGGNGRRRLAGQIADEGEAEPVAG